MTRTAMAVAALLMLAACDDSPGCPGWGGPNQFVLAEAQRANGDCGALDPLEIEWGLIGVPTAQCTVYDRQDTDQLCGSIWQTDCFDTFGSWTWAGGAQYEGDGVYAGRLVFQRFDSTGARVCSGAYDVRFTNQ